MEEKKSKDPRGRKPLPDREKKVQFQVTVKKKNKAKVKKAIAPLVKKLDV